MLAPEVPIKLAAMVTAVGNGSVVVNVRMLPVVEPTEFVATARK